MKIDEKSDLLDMDARDLIGKTISDIKAGQSFITIHFDDDSYLTVNTTQLLNKLGVDYVQ